MAACFDAGPGALGLSTGRTGAGKAFPAKACPGLDPGWRPVRVKKARQIKNLKPVPIQSERALALQLPFCFEVSALSRSLESSAPERPCDDVCGLNMFSSKSAGNAAGGGGLARCRSRHRKLIFKQSVPQSNLLPREVGSPALSRCCDQIFAGIDAVVIMTRFNRGP